MGVSFGSSHGGSEKYAVWRSELAENVGLRRKAGQKARAKKSIN
jgi:predicted transcriptional regulator